MTLYINLFRFSSGSILLSTGLGRLILSTMSIFNRGRSHSTTETPYAASSLAASSSSSKVSLGGRTYSSPDLVAPTSLAPAPSAPSTQHAAPSFLRRNPQVLARLYCSLAENSVHPPDYSALAPLAPRYPIFPRPEEGQESLPAYSPAVYREGVMCRKQELVSPYLMANQRAWQLVYAQLNNTQLNIYGLTPTTSAAATVAVKTRRGSVAGVPEGVAEHEAVTTAPERPHALPGTLVCGGAFRVGKLLHSYTLQFGEVGLAVDYGKRPYVLRVRLEAEQFLLETGTPEQQIAWINGVQMGIDVALSLEERGLPKCRLIPRRRRGGAAGSEQGEQQHARHQGNPFSRFVSRFQSKPRRGMVASETPDPRRDSAASTETNRAGVATARSGSGPSAHCTGSSSGAANANAESGCGLLRGDVSSHDDVVTSGGGALAQVDEAASEYGQTQDDGADEADEDMARETGDEEMIYDMDDEVDLEDYDMSSTPSSSAPSLRSTSPRASNSDLEEEEEEEEEVDLKWAPERPEQTHKGFLKYAHRCLIPLPSSTPWVDKHIVHKGRKYIVKQDVLERVVGQRVGVY